MTVVDRGANAVWFLNTRVHIVVPAAAGEDRLSVLQHRAPFGDSPPLHIHHTEDEVFRVLAGRFRFRVGEEEYEVGPGETIMAPKKVPHQYCVESAEGGSWITITSPGDFEGLVRAVGRPAEDDGLPAPHGPPTPEEEKALIAACGAHHIEILGPPMAPRG
ncbi:MAG: cupin domain-containing protein [Bauldia sp.]|uniref:cupin domain-containing protein n=1 Tax=Bauldia sp. TaxID=2575872 RepID=UPI001DFCC29A|nr:cupin domain-containing protein [Bauldia sp.]MCB1496024.1 cupin domain-containing protein [Bauldia sp.]